ncbi:hypothetical protein, partial [Pseudomonas viridiflava]|uniref:hypothetical protein n=4 Tax=Pseudomonas viridiflava TaxID=33069 RepID=UPI00197C8727
GLVREKASTFDEYSSSEIQYSRTSPLPQNPVSSVGYRLFDKRGLARDAVDAVYQKKRVIVHRRQAASHGSMLVMLTASAAAYDALHILPHYFHSLPQSIRFSEHPSLQNSASRTSPCRPTHRFQIKPLYFQPVDHPQKPGTTHALHFASTASTLACVYPGRR